MRLFIRIEWFMAEKVKYWEMEINFWSRMKKKLG